MNNPMKTYPSIIPVDYNDEIPDFSFKLRSIIEFNESVRLFQEKSFAILAANIRGMRSNFPHFEAFLILSNNHRRNCANRNIFIRRN